jgi:holo-[acyl-carrier protein] synthase
MITGIGTDILEIQRIRQVLQRYPQKFMSKILTETEREYCLSHKDPAPFVAARFAGKEAIAKALGCGFGEMLDFHDISIFHSPLGAPIAELSEKAKTRFNDPSIKLTLSHCKMYVVAFALVETG